MEGKLIEGFRVEIDKTPPQWHGTVFLRQTRFKEEAYYVTSTNPSLILATMEIILRFGESNLQRIDIKEYRE